MSSHPTSPKILITGASGFIGSFLVEAALKQGYQVYAGVRPGSSRIYLQQEDIRFFRVDLSSRELMERQLGRFNKEAGGFDIVIHNAGITRARRKSDFERVNSGYTQNLVEALQASGKLPEKFVFMSSMATYGPGDAAGFTPIRLQDPQNPVSSYAKSKLSAETYLKSLSSMNTIILRPTAVYGPRDKDFLSYFRMIASGMDLRIGRHRQLLSFVYVKDLASIIFKILGSGNQQSAYIISDGKSYEKEEMGKMIKNITHRSTFDLQLPLLPVRLGVKAVEKLYGIFGRMPFIHSEKLKEISASNWSCDSSDIWEEFQTGPEYNLENGITETAIWYKENGWLK